MDSMPRASKRSQTPTDLENLRQPDNPIRGNRLQSDDRESLSPVLDWRVFESLALPGENVAYSLHDGNGVFLESTKGCQTIWGTPAKQLKGKSIFQIVQDDKALRNWMLQAHHPRDEELIQVSVALPKSHFATINLKSVPTFLASAPKESRIVLKAVLSESENGPSPFSGIEFLRSTHQTDGTFLSKNRNWKQLLQEEENDLFAISIEADRSTIESFLARIQKSSAAQSCVLRLRPLDGRQRSLLLTGHISQDSKESIEIEARDITLDRGNLATSLINAGIEFAKESIVIVNKDENDVRICYVNQAFGNLTGHSHSSIVGSSIARLSGPKTSDNSTHSIKSAIQEESAFRTELLLYRKDKSTFWGKVELQPLRDEMGKSSFFLLTLEDLSEARKVANKLKSREAELKEALQSLKDTQRTIIQQENLRALGQMASGIAHDFNNLLAPILGFSELLLNIPENAKNDKKLIPYLEKIQIAAKDGAAVVGRLREFYRAQNGDEQFTAIDPTDLVTQAKEITSHRWKNQAEASGKTITFNTCFKCSKQISGNASELRQVLTNLTINAVDAIAESGLIHIDVTEDKSSVSIKITDTGSGMSPAIKDKCLDPFYTTKGELGTGLGLSIVVGVVQRHGGRFNIESELGKGTQIEIILPAIIPQAENPVLEIEKTVCPKLRVLLVDDEEILLEVLSELLGSSGHIVDNYSDPFEALSEFKANHYDLVITDRAMPTMSGDHLAKAIKTESPSTPVFMVTGFGDMIIETGDFPKYVDEVLAKPLPLDLLNQKVNELVAKKN